MCQEEDDGGDGAGVDVEDGEGGWREGFEEVEEGEKGVVV